MPKLRDLLRTDAPLLWDALAQWHAGLDEDRGGRAQLRRAKSVDVALFCPAYHAGLAGMLKARNIELTQDDLVRLALPVGVLAHAKALARGPHVARAFAQAEKGDQKVRDARFRRLLLIQDRDRLYTALVRLVRYLDGAVEPKSLVTGAFWWNDLTRREWARHYYLGGASDAAA